MAHYFQLTNDFLDIEELTFLLHKRRLFSKELRQYILKNCQNETVPLVNAKGDKFDFPMFCQGYRNGSKKLGFYIYKKAVPAFLQRHHEGLRQMDVPIENIAVALGVIPELKQETIQHANLVKLWDMTVKIHRNTKLTSALCTYIKETYINEKFFMQDPDSFDVKEESMFVFVKPPQGKSGVAIRKEALPIFLKRHGKEIKEVALKMENENAYTSLRLLSCYLGKPNIESKLLAFIQEHLDDKFYVTDDDGNISELPIAEIIISKCNNPNLCIVKKAIPAFIKKYQNELIELGFEGVQALVKNFEKEGNTKTFLNIQSLAKRLFQGDRFASVLNKGIQDIFINDTVEETNTQTGEVVTRPLFRARFNKRMIYFILEKDVPLFIRKYKDWLLKKGVSPLVLNYYDGKQEILHKTDNMIAFRSLVGILQKHHLALTGLFNEIKEKHLNDTYTYLDENNIEHTESIFVYAKNIFGFTHYFRNQEALFSFFRNNKDLFQRHGIAPEHLDDVTGDKEGTAYSPDYIFIPDIQYELRLTQSGISDFIKNNFLDKTITEKGADGTYHTRALFTFVKGKNKGAGNYAIHKNDLPYFATTYQKELHVKKGVVEALNAGMEIKIRRPDQLAFTTLVYFLGNKTREGSTLFSKLVKEKYLHETAIVNTNDGNKEKAIFNYAYHPEGGVVTLYIDSDSIIPFVQKHEKELLAIGFKKERLAQAFEQIRQNPRFYDELNEQNKILNRKRQENALLRKQMLAERQHS